MCERPGIPHTPTRSSQAPPHRQLGDWREMPPRWAKVLAVVVVALSAISEVRGQACSIDKPGVSKLRSYEMVLQKMEPCFKFVITEAMIAALRDPKTLADVRAFFREFCPHHSEVTACMARVRSGLSPCHNRNVSVPFMILSHLSEHLLKVGCQDEGRRLALVLHGYIALKQNRTQMTTLRNCLYKTVAVFTLTDDADIDLTSESYMTFKEMPMLKRCLKHIDDEGFKSAVEWSIDEMISSFRCLDPKTDALVTCNDLDVSLVNVTNVCELRPQIQSLLYDQLEDEAIDCFSFVYSHELREGTDYGDLGWLMEDYRRMCQIHRVSLDCLLEKAGLAEACLPEDEDQQFQLFMNSLDDVIQMGCLEDGKRVARIMHEVYRLKATPGSHITDCFKTIVANRGHTATNTTKNIRFYQDMISFKNCVVGELQDNEAIAKEADEVISDILGNMKCVRSEDGDTVLCETLHTH